MPVVITKHFVLVAAQAAAGIGPDHPIIGWRNVATALNISASSSDPLYPPGNLANPATHLFWKGTTIGGLHSITVSLPTGTEAMDYVAIARHNLGTTATPVTIGYYDTATPPVFTELVGPTILPNNEPALFRFTEQALDTITVNLGAGAGAIPQISVVYAGKLLVLPRKLYQGFAPINYGRIAKVTNGRSEAGHFLGRIVLQEFVKDTVPLSLIDPAYFRNNISEFLIDSKARPFFFAWRPQSYPDEIGYAHMTNDPVPVNEAPHGLVAMQMEMTGIV